MKLIHGDCLDVLKTLDSGSVDAVITDPPYLVDYRGRWNSDWRQMANDDKGAWLAPLAVELFRLLPVSGFVVCFYGWGAAGEFLAAFRAAGFRPTSQLIFVKNQIGLGYHTRGRHEQAYLFAKGKARPQKVLPDVLGWTRVRKAVHPTQKPLDAIVPLVERFCPEGGACLDPFMGSGTTGIACLQTGRRFIGVEIDKDYYDIACQRIADAQVKNAA